MHALYDWWTQQTWQELTGATTGLICVYLAAANSVWNWPIAIISTGLYIYVFARTGFYADMLQYTYFFLTSFYGWACWSKHPTTEDKSPVVRATGKQLLISLIAVIVITPALGYTLITFAAKLHYNPPAYPYIDSFCTACSLVAQIFLARKILENWLIWIFVDVIYTVVYFKKDLQVTAFMFAVLIIIAIFGYIDWKKSSPTQPSPDGRA